MRFVGYMSLLSALFISNAAAADYSPLHGGWLGDLYTPGYGQDGYADVVMACDGSEGQVKFVWVEGEQYCETLFTLEYVDPEYPYYAVYEIDEINDWSPCEGATGYLIMDPAFPDVLYLAMQTGSGIYTYGWLGPVGPHPDPACL